MYLVRTCKNVMRQKKIFFFVDRVYIIYHHFKYQVCILPTIKLHIINLRISAWQLIITKKK